ncbi:hypothetical protein E2C01_102516 [Portunus trituberculatus]|uniref:Uncharacterized protein n=1 Tax=Portunus trituberculatus TaxID=210409 RepID=A0A5B7K8F9_PORTR|nr:hypothetical protein [Portunus trituberculatus]
MNNAGGSGRGICVSSKGPSLSLSHGAYKEKGVASTSSSECRPTRGLLQDPTLAKRSAIGGVVCLVMAAALKCVMSKACKARVKASHTRHLNG